MGSRSRKRGRPSEALPPVVQTPAPAPTATPTPGPLDAFTVVAPPAGSEAAQAKPKKLRGEAANEAVRAELKPLAFDERPPALLVAIALTGLVGLANVVLYLAGVQVDGRAPSAAGVVGFAGLMFLMSWGMWGKRYWAILGFQALLALIVVVFALFLPTASNLQAVLVCTVIVGLGGWLFWKLVRVLSRVQMPERPGV